MFGPDIEAMIFDASIMPALLLSLTAGFISFLSPCVLPVVAPYLAYMAGANINPDGMEANSNRKVIIAASFFVLGLSTVFLFIGFTASIFAQMFIQYQEQMAMVAGATIFVFGLHFLGIFRIPFLYREARIDAGDRGGSAFGAYILGLAFAFGWTPCIGPILGMITSLALQEDTVGRSVVLLGAYSIGLGIPFLLAAIFMNRFLSVSGKLKRYMGRIEKTMGGMLVVVGILLFTGVFTEISNWLLSTFPGFAQFG